MVEIVDFIKENAREIIIIVVVVIFLLVLINIKGINLNEPKPESKLVQEVTVETFSNDDTEKVLESSSEKFCESYLGNSQELEKACNELTKTNCGSVGCCVYIADSENEKCVAGDIQGPTYKTDKDGKLITFDSYYYLGKLRGSSMPT